MKTFKDFYTLHQKKLIESMYEDIDLSMRDYPLPAGTHGLSMVRGMVTGGKMIRGMLVLMSAQMHGVPITKELYHLAGAIELLHAGFLIHDDIMDNDYRRRNRDSIYYQYIKEGQEKNAANPEHYGVSMAMCLGDMVFFLVYEIIAKRISDPEKVQCVTAYISQEVQHVGPAQMMDASYGQIPEDPTEDEIQRIYTYKTAHYTFSLPLILGGTFAPSMQITTLKAIGKEMGIVFQLKDDDLGIFGSSDSIGKEVGSDVRENKKTLLRHLLFQSVSPSEREKLHTIFGNPHLSVNDLTFVKICIEKTGVRETIAQEMKLRKEKALALMKSLDDSGKMTVLLADLMSYIISRTN